MQDLPPPHDPGILIIDFGSQYTKLIARRVREAHVYCEIHPPNKSIDWIRAWAPVGIILSGGPNSVYGENIPTADPALLELGIPILGVCYGMQLMAQLSGGNVYNYQAWFSALAYQLTGEARYATDAIERVDAWVQGEEMRVAQNMNAEVAGDSYLYVGEHIGDLALTLDWCFDRVTEAQRTRWIAYAKISTATAPLSRGSSNANAVSRRRISPAGC